MNYSRGFIAPVMLILAAVLLVVIGPSVYKTLTYTDRPAGPIVATTTASSDQVPVRTYSLGCGVSVKVNNDQPVVTNSSMLGQVSIESLRVGPPMPDSLLEIECRTRNSESGEEMNKVSKVLGIQSNGSAPVNKTGYEVFDAKTLNSVQTLYSAKDRGYRIGSETIGFENERWWYTFSFLRPQHAQNQDTFLISVDFAPTPTIQNSGWQTYKNDKYSFKIEYPAKYKLSFQDAFGTFPPRLELSDFLPQPASDCAGTSIAFSIPSINSGENMDRSRAMRGSDFTDITLGAKQGRIREESGMCGGYYVIWTEKEQNVSVSYEVGPNGSREEIHRIIGSFTFF